MKSIIIATALLSLLLVSPTKATNYQSSVSVICTDRPLQVVIKEEFPKFTQVLDSKDSQFVLLMDKKNRLAVVLQKVMFGEQAFYCKNAHGAEVVPYVAKAKGTAS